MLFRHLEFLTTRANHAMQYTVKYLLFSMTANQNLSPLLHHIRGSYHAFVLGEISLILIK